MKKLLEHQSLIYGLSFIIGTSICAFILGNSIKSFQNSQRTVVVKGLSEREAPADIVIWRITPKRTGANLNTVYQDIQKDINLIYNFMTNEQIAENEITISQPNMEDAFSFGYRETRLEARFSGEQTISLFTPNVNTVRSIFSKFTELARKGGLQFQGNNRYDSSSLEYLFTNLNSIKPSMIKEANEHARAAALQFANDSQSRLGKIKKASQGQFVIENRDSVTPYIKKVRVVSTIEYFLVD
ncbi:MAG: SIMPL domain-containing protein [Brevinema sp.]